MQHIYPFYSILILTFIYFDERFHSIYVYEISVSSNILFNLMDQQKNQSDLINSRLVPEKVVLLTQFCQ